MTGGIIQMVISGKQDIYLTINPEITFFKKVYKRHTNFSTELIEILPEQTINFNDELSFILNQGDAIHRCYFEITLPSYSFSDKYITNTNYIDRKKLIIANLTTQYNTYKTLYDNLKGFVDVESNLYRILYNILQTENITLSLLKEQVASFNYKNKLTKDLYKTKVDETILNEINISSYISNLTLLVTNATTYDSLIFISKTDIINKITIYYNQMVYYLNYYNELINETQAKMDALIQPNQINFNFAEYLGHNFFEYVKLEIGGNEFDKYTKDILHIQQMHNVSPDQMPNYLTMIGHTPDMITYNNNIKGNRKILVPLIFWFNKNPGASLPLVAMQYSTVVINTKLSNISKIICFENYEKNYLDVINVTVSNLTTFTLNTNLKYTSYTININNKSINYVCNTINAELLLLKFPELNDTQRALVLKTNGTYGGSGSSTDGLNYIMNKDQWFHFLMTITNDIYKDFIYKIMSYYPYINYNLYCSSIEVPDIKLICEAVFLDDIERTKFAGGKLEYIVERFVSDTFTIKNTDFFDCELSFNNPCKELIWYIQPNLFIDGYSPFGQNYELKFDINNYTNKNILIKQQFILNQLDVLLSNVDNNYYTNVLSYKFLNNTLPDGLYYHPFCLYPEETQPSGTCNFRYIKGKQYNVILNSLWLKEYLTQLKILFTSSNTIDIKNTLILKMIGKVYDMFIVTNGQAKLLFN
jgi:hypothetical protein